MEGVDPVIPLKKPDQLPPRQQPDFNMWENFLKAFGVSLVGAHIRFQTPLSEPYILKRKVAA